MGTREEVTPTKPSKAASSTQEITSTPVTPSYPDWSSSMQAFYGGGGTPPFFPSSVASPTPHPFIWGSQHPMMPPYGTPVPYPAMYPHGVYAHPNMSMAQGPLQGTAESEAKASEGKDRALSKKTKGTSGKAASGSGNDVGTQSGESGSEGSSDHSNDNNNQEFSGAKKGSFDQMLADGANTQNNAANFQTSLVAGNPLPASTNLNIGMDLWPSGSGAMKLQPNRPASSGMMNDQWIQDERELKKQKRKQSNRESARKSRLRKQAECEELQHRVETLTNENRSLRDELQRLSEECEKLTSENNSIKEELTKLCGPEAVSRLEMNNSVATQLDARGDEGNC